MQDQRRMVVSNFLSSLPFWILDRCWSKKILKKGRGGGLFSSKSSWSLVGILFILSPTDLGKFSWMLGKKKFSGESLPASKLMISAELIGKFVRPYQPQTRRRRLQTDKPALQLCGMNKFIVKPIRDFGETPQSWAFGKVSPSEEEAGHRIIGEAHIKQQ
ncbi:hypothetical protein CEXT_571431 [Caerostris extrusa]|uniref:Uncharacterized protein n=1 Tax=Caerostris extrusa TaxID=172846 RepID=A0AAV4UBD2_CAEEX|nr:hypothetical protein CEXT_571431 [Caerostris extrusa]